MFSGTHGSPCFHVALLPGQSQFGLLSEIRLESFSSSWSVAWKHILMCGAVWQQDNLLVVVFTGRPVAFFLARTGGV